MSDEERLVAMGRAVEEYGQLRKRRAALLAEAARLGGVLGEIAGYLTAARHGAGTVHAGAPLPDLHHYPTAEQLASICGEALAVSARKEALERTLRQFGVEVRPD